jgi:hypothetical protein
VIIEIEHGDEMWDAVLTRCKEIVAGATYGRSAAMYGSDGRSVSACLWSGQDDGTDKVWMITARYHGFRQRQPLTVSVDGPWTDTHDAFWAKEAADHPGAVVVGHTHYRIQPDRPVRDADLAGHAGRTFHIRFHDGREVTTRNLWHQGTIPPAWRDRLPDNAEWVPTEERPRPCPVTVPDSTGEQP